MTRLLLTLALTTFLFYSSFASHLLGADISYECIGNGVYRVTLELYRDCNGITPASSQTLSYSSSVCGASGSIQLSLLGTPVDITPLCPSQQSACGGNGSIGIQNWTYQGVLNLPPGCGDDWLLGWSQCCRNGAINTLSGASSQDMYVGVLLDNTATPFCNSSPVFNNSPGSIVCVNQPVVYNHGVSDADGDSLYFSLGTCLQASNQNVVYAGGFNGTNPLTTSSGVNIDPNTGALTFTPTTQQVGVLCVKVQEFRNGVLIGEVNRDMQFTVIACSNVPPEATGVDGSSNTDPLNFETSICANGNICFNVDGFDANGNNVSLSWNNEIPGATFVVSNNGTTSPTGEFCWNPGVSDLGPNIFTVNVVDDACPIVGSGTYTFIVNVLPSPNTLDAGANDTICLGESSVLTATSSPTATSYTWTPSSSLSPSTGATVTATPAATTAYEVSAVFPDGCNLTDVVFVGIAPNPTVVVNPTNAFNCSGQTTVLTAVGNASSYSWSPGGLTGSVVSVNAASTTTYTVTATSSFGCTSTANATVTVAAPTGDVCNVLYVTPTGSPGGAGSKTDPMDLQTALEEGACNGTVVKMAVGDYVTDTVINKVTSYITLEGGFDPSINWDKVSNAGATRILRTATQSYSLVSNSIVMGSGIINESGPNPEVVAISVANQSEFRFQDITIETELISPGTTMASYDGPSVVGVRLSACDNYNIVRTQILTDNAGNGSDQIWSILATDGGDATALDLISNGAGGNVVSSFLNAGNAGTGGTGTPNGTNGVSNNVALTGTPLSTSNINFNLAGQPVIRMDDVACTATLMDFSQASSGNWTFGSGSSPGSATGSAVSTQYSSTGRKDVAYSGNNYAGFANIILDDQVLPTFTTSAPLFQGQYRICAGDAVDFTATNGGTGYIYHWDMDGGSTPNNYDGAGFQNLDAVVFNTPGIYTISLEYETNCCGISQPATLDLYVEETPSITIAPYDTTLCFGSSSPVSISVEDNINFGQITWSPSIGLDSSNTFTVNALPGDTQTYLIVVTDSTGLCSDLENVTVNNVNIELTTSSVNAICSDDGSATVVATGGSGSYSYLWDDPSSQTGATASNLAIGTYTVIVTDNVVGCQDSAVVVVNPGPGALVGYVSATSPVSCVGNGDGYAVVSVIGGNPPFDFFWSPAGGTTLGTMNTSDTSALLPGGNYTVYIADASECDYTVDVFIPEPDSLRLDIDTLINPTCIGATNGSITVFADGGNAPLTVTWDDPSAQTGITAIGLGVGTYCATVVDDNGCSDVMCFTLTAPLLTTIVDTTVCYGTMYTFPNGSSTMLFADSSRVDSLLTAINCDSIVTTNVTVVPEKVSTIDTIICFGESITVNGNVYDTTAIGVTDTAFNIGPFMCDSVVTINLIVQDVFVETIDTTLCQGESLTVNGTTYTANGTYLDTIFYANTGCDSLQYVIDLSIDSFTVETIDTTLCQGESLTVNGVTYTASGLYADTAFYSASGCDSIQYVIDLNIDSFIVETIDTNICQGQSILVNGISYNVTGVYADTAFYSVSGCDSIQYVIDLVVDSFEVETIDTTICQGESLTVNGVTYTTSGSYLDTAFYSFSGCDSIQYVIDLQIDSFTIENIDTTICQGQSLTVNGVTYTNSGLYNDTAFYTASGCDSIQFVIDLQIDSFEIVNIDTTVCFGESIVVNGEQYDATGFYQDTLFHPSGCDQIQYNIDLEVLDEKLGLVDTAICDGESIFVNGTEYNTTVVGAQEVFVVGPYACDSTVTINLQVNELPELSASANPDSIPLGLSSELIAVGNGDFVWDAIQNDSIFIVTPEGTSSYTVELTDSNGCVTEVSVTVYIIGASAELIKIPDAFTPNRDGINDVFRIVTDQTLGEVELIIYNRWGDNLFQETGDAGIAWDGTHQGEEQPNDVYIYLFRIKTLEGEEFFFRGDVTLYR